MNYIYFYAALAIAYQAFKFFRARQQASIEKERKAKLPNSNRQKTSYAESTRPNTQTIFFEGFGEEASEITSQESKIISYEDANQQPIVESVEVKAYQVPKPKKPSIDTTAYEIKKASPIHPILKGLKSKSEIRKAFIYSEIFNRKF